MTARPIAYPPVPVESPGKAGTMTPGKTATVSDTIRPYIEAASAAPRLYAQEAAAGRRFIGWFCTYTPLELIHAAGFIPVRITGGGATTGRGDLLTPAFLCPFLRRAVEKGMEGEYDFLTGIVQGYTCDAACGVLNIWAENLKGKIFHSLPLPYNDTPASRAFLRSGLIELAGKLNAAGGSWSMEKCETSLVLYDTIRLRVLDLYERSFSGRQGPTAGEMLTIVRAGHLVSPERFLDLLEKTSAAPETGLRRDGGVPVLVSGSVIDDARVPELLEECGGRIVADDLCTGRRGFDPPAGTGADPLERLIDRCLRRAPCPARARAEERAGVITGLIERSGARGVVFILQKFCTPHLGDLPALTGILRTQGVPVLLVEMEEEGLAEGQLRTRFEGFFEMLGGRHG